MKNTAHYLFGFLCLAILAFASPYKKKQRIWLAGDSTMCLYGPERAPLTGWGMPFANFFDADVEVLNKARGGRSTRTFISEGLWKNIADSIQTGDYVFIQFGHNDEAKEEVYKDRYTPVADYKNNLKLFISQSRAHNAIPVLITPVSRMRFDKAGNIEETHHDYSEAVHIVGRETATPVIDLDSSSRALMQQMGKENSKYLFMQLDSGVNPHYPKGQKDNTHFNEYGARRIAELVLESVSSLKLDLVNYIVIPPVKK